MKTRSDYAAEGKELFKHMAAEDSGIRAFSEARRENGAKAFDPGAASNAFEHGLRGAVERIGEIAGRFATKAAK